MLRTLLSQAAFAAIRINNSEERWNNRPRPRAPQSLPYRRSSICAGTSARCFFRRDDQLPRPTGHRYAQADFAKEGVWDENGYSWVVFAFQTAYAAGLLIAGRVMDWMGTRKGFSLSVVFWSVAAMAHALASSVGGFIAARLALGLGEAGNFPASIKTVAEWFPKKERALATGVFNAGTNVGILAAAAIVPFVTLRYGWQWAFIVTGLVGFVWLFFWLALYRQPGKHPRLTQEEFDHIQSDPPDTEVRIPWAKLIPHRQTWAFAVGKFMTDPVWWIYLFWLPDFLNKNYGIDLKSVGLPLIIVYLIADIGSVGGGWISSSLIKRGWEINKARKTAMLVCALSVVPVILRPGRRTSGWRCCWSDWRRRLIKAGQPTSSRRRRTCFLAKRSARWSALAGWPEPLAACWFQR